MSRVPVAFYAPLKPPDHPRPSGDRTMARLLIQALEQANFAPRVASSLRTWEGAGDEACQREIRSAGAAEAARLINRYLALPAEARPRLWFTYHCYYKAPDHLGPAVSRALGIPYVVAEASRAPKRACGAWSFAHEHAEAAIDAADLLLVLTATDRQCLERALRPGQRLVELPPFVACDGPAPRRDAHSGIPRLLAVAMMRPGDKLASYRLLAEALQSVRQPWHLEIVGDGPARPEVEACFADLRERVTFHGEMGAQSLHQLYRCADCLVWPAVNEAFGMVLLEAQAEGCPVVAGAFGGVPDVVRPGATGLLSRPGDAGDFARCVTALLADPERRLRMGETATDFVHRERSLEAAASVLREALGSLLSAPRVA